MADTPGKSRAKKLQEDSLSEVVDDPIIRITVILDNAHEIHLTRPESVVRGLVDPDVPDCFIQIPCELPSVKHRLIHTSRVKELLIHDEVRFKLPG